jgi:hypothetical protein
VSRTEGADYGGYEYLDIIPVNEATNCLVDGQVGTVAKFRRKPWCDGYKILRMSSYEYSKVAKPLTSMSEDVIPRGQLVP